MQFPAQFTTKKSQNSGKYYKALQEDFSRHMGCHYWDTLGFQQRNQQEGEATAPWRTWPESCHFCDGLSGRWGRSWR